MKRVCGALLVLPLLVVLACSLALHILALNSFPQVVLPSAFFRSSQTRSFAHRGSKKLFPQNTLFAFQASHDMGADILEMDLHLTKDAHVVVIHDHDLGTVANRSDILVEHATLNELLEFDFGSQWTTSTSKTFPYRDLGIRIATLDQVLTAFPTAYLNVELKVSGLAGGMFHAAIPLATSVCNLLRKHKATNRVLVMSFSDWTWFEFRRICPEVATAAGPLSLLPLVLFAPLIPPNFPFQAIQIPQVLSSYNNALVQRAIKNWGLAVHVWTVDDALEMDRLIAQKVDGIMSDRLDILLERVHGETGLVPEGYFNSLETSQACAAPLWFMKTACESM